MSGDLFSPPKDKSECPWCHYRERSKGRCSENCDCKHWYWAFPLSCLNCGLGLVHVKWIVPINVELDKREIRCDSCDKPGVKPGMLSTCPSTFFMCPDCPREKD